MITRYDLPILLKQFMEEYWHLNGLGLRHLTYTLTDIIKYNEHDGESLVKRVLEYLNRIFLTSVKLLSAERTKNVIPEATQYTREFNRHLQWLRFRINPVVRNK